LKDGYSGDRTQGIVEPIIDGYAKPVLNPSGYYTFLDLPAGRYEVNVVSENYLDEKIVVNIEADLHIFKVIILTPRPCYPFPAGETLVRGTLKDSKGPIPGAILSGSLPARNFFSKTDDRGEFVIFFGALDDEEVMKENGMTYIKGPDVKGQKKDIQISGEYRSEDGRLLRIKGRFAGITVGTTNFRDMVITIPAVPTIEGLEKKVRVARLEKETTKSKATEIRADDLFLPYDRHGFPEFI
jgi:hypothetical protein